MANKVIRIVIPKNTRDSKRPKPYSVFWFVDGCYRQLAPVKRLFVGCLIMGMAFQPCLGGNPTAIPESINGRCQQLGIYPRMDDVQTQLPDFFIATVIDAQMLRSMGLFGAKNGERIKVFQLDPLQWRIKDYRTGQSIFVSFPNPAP